MAVTGSTAEAAAEVIAAKTITSATAGKCAAGKPGTSENKHNCKNNHGVAQHFDLFEMLPASASIQGPDRSVARTRASVDVLKSMNGHLQSLVRSCCCLEKLRYFGRTKSDVPITRKPQVADPELGLGRLKKWCAAQGGTTAAVAQQPG
jgi:hypothetical protein